MDKPTPAQNSFHIRFAQEADISAILGFIHALADYEHMSDQVIADDALLREWIFEKKKAEVLIGEEQGFPVGMALFFHNFSDVYKRQIKTRANVTKRMAYRARDISKKGEKANTYSTATVCIRMFRSLLIQ